MYQGFRLNLGERNEMIILRSLMTTFKISNIFQGSSKNWLKSKIKPSNKLSMSKFLIHKVEGSGQ